MINWEAGERTPREFELIAVLDALNLSWEEREALLTLAGYFLATAVTADTLPLPEGTSSLGELMQALRMQSGLSAEQVATSLGVSYVSVKRWERGTVVPSQEIRERFCTACGARPDERLLILHCGMVHESVPQLSLDFLVAQSELYRRQLFTDNPVSELTLIAFEQQLQPWMATHPEALRLLARSYALRGVLRGNRGNRKTAIRYARWSLELVTNRFVPDQTWLLALWIARQGAGDSEFRWLLSWLDAPFSPALRVELLCQLSDCAVNVGDSETAQEMLLSAREEIYRDGSGDSNLLKQWDNSRFGHLISACQVDEAMALCEPLFSRFYPYERINLMLQAASLMVSTGEKNEAHTLIAQAKQDIELHGIHDLKGLADFLAGKLD
ncbi:MAG: hypothetical protein OHK0029_23830 [Armatimonadaceae bacterium]